MLPLQLPPTIPKRMYVQSLENGRLFIQTKVHRSWMIVPLVLAFGGIVWLLVNLLLLDRLREMQGIGVVLLGIILFIIGWPIAIWIRGIVRTSISSEGLQQQLFWARWAIGRQETVLWQEVQWMGLMTAGLGDTEREIQLVTKRKKTIEIKKYYTTEQLIYIERCLRGYHQAYQEEQRRLGEQGVDWSEHLIEE